MIHIGRPYGPRPSVLALVIRIAAASGVVFLVVFLFALARRPAQPTVHLVGSLLPTTVQVTVPLGPGGANALWVRYQALDTESPAQIASRFQVPVDQVWIDPHATAPKGRLGQKTAYVEISEGWTIATSFGHARDTWRPAVTVNVDAQAIRSQLPDQVRVVDDTTHQVLQPAPPRGLLGTPWQLGLVAVGLVAVGLVAVRPLLLVPYWRGERHGPAWDPTRSPTRAVMDEEPSAQETPEATAKLAPGDPGAVDPAAGTARPIPSSRPRGPAARPYGPPVGPAAAAARPAAVPIEPGTQPAMPGGTGDARRDRRDAEAGPLVVVAEPQCPACGRFSIQGTYTCDFPTCGHAWSHHAREPWPDLAVRSRPGPAPTTPFTPATGPHSAPETSQ